jgi:F0F1-type ATP synthase epsilon subunit
LEVKIYWPPAAKKEAFTGKAKAISSRNRLGNFDVLFGHANFISLIFNDLIIHTEDKKLNYLFERGVLEVSENNVKIFLGL